MDGRHVHLHSSVSMERREFTRRARRAMSVCHQLPLDWNEHADLSRRCTARASGPAGHTCLKAIGRQQRVAKYSVLIVSIEWASVDTVVSQDCQSDLSQPSCQEQINP